MQGIATEFPRRRALPWALALVAGALIGCGGSGQTGGVADIPPETKQANNAMQDFMKSNPRGTASRSGGYENNMMKAMRKGR